MPPSVLYMVVIVSHIPGSLALGIPPKAANDADCMERRVRTISRGYVKKTDVIPATPPQISRLKLDRSSPGVVSKNCGTLAHHAAC
jgi:hypothetical protein